jgi:hypothetical protein
VVLVEALQEIADGGDAPAPPAGVAERPMRGLHAGEVQRRLPGAYVSDDLVLFGEHELAAVDEASAVAPEHLVTLHAVVPEREGVQPEASRHQAQDEDDVLVAQPVLLLAGLLAAQEEGVRPLWLVGEVEDIRPRHPEGACNVASGGETGEVAPSAGLVEGALRDGAWLAGAGELAHLTDAT